MSSRKWEWRIRFGLICIMQLFKGDSHIVHCFRLRGQMANQVVAAQMIPRLGVPGLASPPSGRLPSHLDLLCLLHHQQHYNLVGFQGMGKICCKIDGKIHKARCQEGNDLMVPWDECRTGCIAAKNPCLLAQMKHNWEQGSLLISKMEFFIKADIWGWSFL